MCKLIRRKVKGKYYYYLEESFGSGKRRFRESFYIGSEKPDNKALLEHFNQFKKQLAKKGIKTAVPPLTEFITHVAAVKLEKATREKKHFLSKLTAGQREEFIKREKITFITDSNAIEGSTLNYMQTKNVLSEVQRIEKLKKKYALTGTIREQEEAISLSKCLDLYERWLKQKKSLTEEMILKWHYVLLRKIDSYEKHAGVWRTLNVYIVGSMHKFPHYPQVPRLMSDLIRWYDENKGLIHPVELAAKFHTKFTSVHPFADGNGRMARLLMNYILQLNNFPFTNVPLRKRSRYMETQSAGNKEDYKPFARFLAEEIILQNSKLRK